MQLDAALMSIQQRSVGGCIDMGIAFLREHFWPVCKMTACVAIPFCAATWWLVSRCGWNALHLFLAFGFVSPFLGAALVSEAGKRVFGDEFSIGRGFDSVRRSFFPLGILLLISRAMTFLASCLMFLPGYLVATRYGFLSEIFLLEGQRLKNYERRLTNLEGSLFGRLLFRMLTIAFFYTACVMSLFVMLDLTSGFVLGWPILFGRATSLDYLAEELSHLLTQDELVLTALCAVMWFAYPAARLAWFFCYLDARIRQEGWDIELEFRVEAQRLEAAR